MRPLLSATLINSTDDCIVADSECSNGCRSDLVLERKSLSTDLPPPIIIKFQQSVNNIFMKRATENALQAYKSYQVDPIILIICMNNLSSDIESLTKPNNILRCRSYPSHSWLENACSFQKQL